MGKLVFILGGARSGKSRFAAEYAGKSKPVLYIATYKRTGDKEMEERIRRHKKNRPEGWKVLEEPVELSRAIRQNLTHRGISIIIDCITLWVSNLLLKKKNLEEILEETDCLLKTIKNTDATFILVSNEVGMGVVPVTRMGRKFRDIAGIVNQTIARDADEVYFMLAGIPIKMRHKNRP